MKLTLANAGSLSDTYFSEPLTTFAQDYYKELSVEKVLQFVSGNVIVPRRFQYRVWGDATELAPLSSPPDPRRALGANFSALSVSGTIQLNETDNKGFSVILDDDEINADPKWEVVAVKRAVRTMMEYERSVLHDQLYYTSGVTPVSVTWNGGSGQDPDSDLIQLLQAVESAVGVRPNRIIMTASAWTARTVTLRAQTSLLAVSSAMLTPDQLGAQLGVKLMVPDAVDFAPGSALVFAFYQQDGGFTEDISTIKRFQSLCADGALFRSYKRQVGNKTWEVTVEHYSRLVLTSPTLLGCLAVTTT
jgi:hypothetical protein